MKKTIIVILVILVITAGVITFIFYKKYLNSASNSTVLNSSDIIPDNSFVEGVVKAPAVAGNIINSGIAGKAVLPDGKPFAAMFNIFKANNASKPFISVIAHDDGTFQIPLKPDSYVMKPVDPDGPRAPKRESYPINIGPGQWVQVRIEYR